MTTDKNDLLKVENLEKNEYLVTTSIVDGAEEKVENKNDRITLLNLIIPSTSFKNSVANNTYEQIRPIKSFKLIILLLIIGALLFLFYKITEPTVLLPIILLFASIALPLFLITFHFELSLRKRISLFQLILSVMLGIIIYISIQALKNTFLIRAIYEQTINIIVVPLIWSICEFFFVAVIVRVYNINSVANGILIAVCVGMGYVFSWCLSELFSSFFISVKVSVGDGADQYMMHAMVNDPTFFAQGFDAMFEKVGKFCIYYPLTISSWSVIIGNVVSLSQRSKNKKKDKPTSMYFLIVLVVLLYALSVFTTSFASFDFILKLLCLLVSLSISVRIKNVTLNDTVKTLSESSEIIK